MKKINYCSLILGFIIISACSRTQTDFSEDFNSPEPKVKFKKLGEKVFKIDSLTDYNLLLPQVYNLGEGELLVCLNILKNAIDMYDYESGTLSKTVSFPNEGPGSLSSDLIGFQILSEDSLLLVDKLNILYFSDLEGGISHKVDLDPEGIPGLPLIQPNSLPVVKMGKNIFIENYYLRNEDRQMKVVLDLEEMKVDYKLKIPNEYLNGFWGIGDFGTYDFVINKGRFIYNFPNLDSLYIWDSAFIDPVKVNARVRSIDSPIDKILEKGRMPSEKTIEQGAFRSNIYSRLLYDDELGLYFRIVGLSINQGLLDSRDPIKSKERKYLIMILDSEFQWLGEFELPNYDYVINTERIFINKNGIHFQKKGDNEDEAVFDVYQVESIGL